MLFLAHSIFTIQEPDASGCGCAWGAVTCSQWSIPRVTFPVKLTLQKPPHLCHLRLPTSCFYVNLLPQTTFSSPNSHSPLPQKCRQRSCGPKLCIQPKDRTRIRAGHFLTVASLWPPTDRLTFYLHLSHHHNKLLFILQSTCLCAI